MLIQYFSDVCYAKMLKTFTNLTVLEAIAGAEEAKRYSLFFLLFREGENGTKRATRLIIMQNLYFALKFLDRKRPFQLCSREYSIFLKENRRKGVNFVVEFAKS